MEDLTQEFVAESREGLERMELCLTELEQRHGDADLVGEIFRVVHTIKGTTGFLGFSRLQALAHEGESLLAALRDGRIQVTSELISALLELRDGLQAIVNIIEARGSEGERKDDDDRELIGWMKELAAGGCRRCPDATVAGNAEHADAGVVRTGAAAAGRPMDDRTLRIDVEELNRMMNLVGDLVLTRNRMLQCQPGDQCYPEQARRLNTVTTELRESVMRARMQPVGHVFAKFPRMVRDLAQQCGRKVRIEFEGAETALDKSLLEAVRDPLTHAVRNAVDHGIEPEAVRTKAGKPAEGVVRLRAYSQNGAVAIEVTDDGAGISTEGVLSKAVERGLATADATAAMTEREALQLIFAPGFSTAREVTSVSGRGVGMDVVRRNVEQAGGRVEVESQLGTGTTLRLRVPLTLAIIPALVVRCAKDSYALPQSALVELVRVPRSEAKSAVERIGNAELYRLREELLPLVRLGRVLELENGAVEDEREMYIAVLEPEGRRFGLVVDGLHPPEEIVVKPLSAALREIGVYAGATVLGNGKLAMVLDAVEIAARAGVRAVEEKKMSTDAAQDASAGLSAWDAQAEMENSMVVYETAAGSERAVRMAMPLNMVERIATVPLREVEHAGGRAVLQYGSEVIPLEDDGGLLKDEAGAAEGTTIVLICRRGKEHRTGIVVRRVLDVCAGEMIAVDPALSASPLARVNHQVTTMHRGFASAVAVLEGAA